MSVAAELRGVSKNYGSGESQVQALRHIDLQFHAGEITLIEGPSGGGKTTLLEILGLLLPPDAGAVIVAGQDWTGRPERELTAARRQHIAFVFQDFNLLQSLTAHDNIAVVAQLHHANGDAEARRILARFDMTARARHLPAHLSGGQKQRVSIGRALASPGALVLADEPTANLDWTLGEPIIRLLMQLAHEDRRCVVVVSHDPRLEPYADRIVRLSDGCIMTPPQQPVTDLKTEPHKTDRRPGAGPGLGLVAAGLLLLGATLLPGGPRAWAQSAAAPGVEEAQPPVLAAAPGVIEPASRVIQISSDRTGVIRKITVTAGQEVEVGQTLVELDQEEAQALVDLRAAELAAAEAELADLRAWVRPERKTETLAQLQAVQARLVKAQDDYDRVTHLERETAARPSEVRDALEALDVAKAEVRRIQAIVDQNNAGPTVTEVKRAQAHVAEAKAQMEMAQVGLDRRTVRSPVQGRVLYVYMEPGEVVNILAGTPPILSLAAAGNPRLRAEVDEVDIGRVHVGQPVLATSDSFPGRSFKGVVLRMENIMGRRNIRTNRPKERQDVRVREIVIELDKTAKDLPVDLMMVVRFLAEAPARPSADGRPAK